MMKLTCRILWLPLIAFLAGPADAHVRLLVRNTNWYYSRHNCFIGVPSLGIVESTGMGRGITELRVGGGGVTFVHEDIRGIWPPIAYHCPTRLPGGPEVALDLTFGWVYVADGLCWTPGCRSFAQSFLAEGPELVSVGCFVASPPKPINVTLHAQGPDGAQIGATKQFTAGTSRWGFVFWRPGEAPTTPGTPYTLVFRSADGTPWNPFVHSKGNVYDAGLAYFDRVPQFDADLCVLISNPGDGYLRHVPIPNDPRNEIEWSNVPNGQRFVARGKNLIYACVEARCGGETNTSGVYLVIRKQGPKGESIGPRMRLPHMPGNRRSVRSRGIPYGPQSVPLEPGQVYFAGLEFGDGTIPVDWQTRARLYGEEAPGAHPTIASVWTGRIFSDSFEVTWRKGNRSRSVIEYGKPGGTVLGTAEEMGEEGWAAVGGLEPDTTYQFRLTATSPQRYCYWSPWYLVRTRAQDGTLNGVEAMQGFGRLSPYFLPVADAPLAVPPARTLRAEGKPIALANPGFEDGTGGWTLSRHLDDRASGEVKHLKPREGRNMFGWLRVLEGKPNHELHREDLITQRVSVTRGRWYQISVWAVTAEPDWTKDQRVSETWSFPFFMNRCRDRIALVVDPKGGETMEGANVTQWYSTEGEWRLLTKYFQAAADEVTVGAAFYQRGQRAWDAAFIDDFQLLELNQAPY